MANDVEYRHLDVNGCDVVVFTAPQVMHEAAAQAAEDMARSTDATVVLLEPGQSVESLTAAQLEVIVDRSRAGAVARPEDAGPADEAAAPEAGGYDG